MFVNKLTELFIKAFDNNLLDGYMLNVDNSGGFDSLPQTLTGNTANTTIVSPSVSDGRSLVLKGITLITEGNGTIKLKRSSDDETILPVYATNFNKASTSNSLNLQLEPDEHIYVVIEDNGASDETFIGVSYVEKNL